MIQVSVNGSLFGYLAATAGDLVHLSEFKLVGASANFASEELASKAINLSERHFVPVGLSEDSEGETLDTKMGRAGVGKILTKSKASESEYDASKAELERGKRILGEVDMSEEEQKRAKAKEPDSGGGIDLSDPENPSTIKAVQQKARGLGFQVVHDPSTSEFAVYPTGHKMGGDSTYFTNDLRDAHDTLMTRSKNGEGGKVSLADDEFYNAMMAKQENDPDVIAARAKIAKGASSGGIGSGIAKKSQADTHKDFMAGLDSYMSGGSPTKKADLSEDGQVTTRRLSDGTTQVGYHNGQGWVGLHNLKKTSGGYKSDNYPGIKPSVADWVKHSSDLRGKKADLAEPDGTGSTEQWANSDLFSDDQDKHYTDPMRRKINENLLKYAAGRNITCPGCGNVMDWRNTVNMEIGDGNLTMCGDCADRRLTSQKFKDSMRNHSTTKFDIVDGRALQSRNPAMAAHNHVIAAKQAAKVPVVEKGPDPEQYNLGLAEGEARGSGFEHVRAGDHISFSLPHPAYAGKTFKGRVVMTFHSRDGSGGGHVTVNMGGKHGTPAVVTKENFLKNHSTKSAAKGSKYESPGGFNFSEPTEDSNPQHSEAQFGHCGACKKDMKKKFKVGTYTRVECPGCGSLAWMDDTRNPSTGDKKK